MNDTDNEVWAIIPGYNDRYEVSTHGRIRSTLRGITRIRRTSLDVHGYERLELSNNKKITLVYVHRLVALAFIPNPDSLRTVNHKDLVKTNNHINNLEWMSDGDNVRHAIANGVVMSPFKTHCRHGHEFTQENTKLYYKSDGRRVRQCRSCVALRYKRKAKETEGA